MENACVSHAPYMRATAYFLKNRKIRSMYLHINIEKLIKTIYKYFILDKLNKIFITILFLILTIILHFFSVLYVIYQKSSFLTWIILFILLFLILHTVYSNIYINEKNLVSNEKITDESGHTYISDKSPQHLSLFPFIILVGLSIIILYVCNMSRINNELNIYKISLHLLSGAITAILFHLAYYQIAPYVLNKIVIKKVMNSGKLAVLDRNNDDCGKTFPVQREIYDKIIFKFLFFIILYCVFVLLLVFFNETILQDMNETIRQDMEYIKIKKEFSTLYVLFGGFLGAEIMNLYSQK